MGFKNVVFGILFGSLPALLTITLFTAKLISCDRKTQPRLNVSLAHSKVFEEINLLLMVGISYNIAA
jgi:hypothetical protein